MSDVLKKILLDAKEALDSDERFLAIFDLDSTLYDVKERQRKILQQFADNSEFVAKWPEQSARLRTVDLHSKDFGIREALKRVGFSLDTDNDFLTDVMKYWELWFFHNDFLKHDEPMPGAVEFVRAIEALDADIMYLTGRDVPRMLDGTRKSLAAIGFPIEGDHIQIYLKPEKSLEDAEFKSSVIKKIARGYHKVWLFENEPVILNAVSKTSPDVKMVFLDTCHSGREALREKLDTIPHFEVDLEDFREFFIER